MSGRREICDAISAQHRSAPPTASTCSRVTLPDLNIGSCSAPLSGIDFIGSGENFAGEEDWGHLIASTSAKRMGEIENSMVSIDVSVQEDAYFVNDANASRDNSA